MRDVTPQNDLQPDFKSLIQFLIEFIKHPMNKISKLPENWNWATVLTLLVLLSISSGVIAGAIKLNFYRVAAGLFLMPIITLISSMLLGLFLYYYFQFFENRTENFKKIIILVVLASVPFYLFQTISEYFSPITLVGFAMTSLLGIVGLVENFHLEKKRAYRLVGLIFSLVVIAWVLNKLDL